MTEYLTESGLLWNNQYLECMFYYLQIWFYSVYYWQKILYSYSILEEYILEADDFYTKISGTSSSDETYLEICVYETVGIVN